VKKLMLLIVSLFVVIGAVSVSASPLRVPVSDLTTLAGYFPEDSVFFASVRTDDDFIAALDALTERLSGAVPELSGVSVTQSLDMLADDVKRGATFQDLFRTWLGDTAAVGVLPLTTTDPYGSPVVLIALSITDRDAAESFFLSVTNSRDYERSMGDDFTTYQLRRGNTHLAFRDDVLLIASGFEVIADGGAVDARLSDDADFQSALERLPESEYSGVVYLDIPSIYQFALDMSAQAGGSMPLTMQSMMALMDGVQSFALGFTSLDDSTLSIDVMTATDTVALGLPEAAIAPLDLTLAARIPAGTPLVVLGSRFSDSLNYARAMLEELAANESMDFDMNTDDVALAFWMLEFLVRGFTGMNLQDEILPALNGTYALYAGVNPLVESIDSAFDVSSDQLFDFALLFQVTDAAAAARLRDTVSATLHDLPAQRQDNLSVSFEDINGTEAVRLGIETYTNFGHEFELLLAVSDEVFVFGSRRYVEAALNPDVGLDRDPQWQEALQYMTPSPYSLLYQSSDNLVALGDLFMNTPGRDFTEIGTALNLLSTLVSSSSISYARQDDGGMWMRAVLTLNAE
jgi:hypothetical protein